MKLSDRIREEISKSGIVRWDDLEEEVSKLEKEIDILESTPGTIETIQLKDSIYLSGIQSALNLRREYNLDVETTTYIIHLYDEHHTRIITNGNEE
jgi:hypothetical protein